MILFTGAGVCMVASVVTMASLLAKAGDWRPVAADGTAGPSGGRLQP